MCDLVTATGVATRGLLAAIHKRSPAGVTVAAARGADLVRPDAEDATSSSALHMAVETEDPEIVEALLKCPGVQVNAQDIFGCTPLIMAVIFSYLEIIEMLLTAKANPNIADSLRRTPVYFSVCSKRTDIAALLIHHGARVTIETTFGEQPLTVACTMRPSMAMAWLLLEHGKYEEDYNYSARSAALMDSILLRANVNFIRLLIAEGADVNYHDPITDRSPLHMAAVSNCLPTAQLLIKNGAVLNVKTTYGISPLEMAKLYDSRQVADYFEAQARNTAGILPSRNTRTHT